jgi:succinate dehydrogenase (ubiquinone) membrane anchor subunit
LVFLLLSVLFCFVLFFKNKMFARSVRSIAQRRFPSRKFHSEGKKTAEVREISADESGTLNKWFHKTGPALMVLSPLALLLPSHAAFPVDVILGVVIPFHSHFALNVIITDYVPKNFRSAARFGVLATTLLTVVGIFKLNMDGPGLTGSVKALWADKKQDSKQEHH